MLNGPPVHFSPLKMDPLLLGMSGILQTLSPVPCPYAKWTPQVCNIRNFPRRGGGGPFSTAKVDRDGPFSTAKNGPGGGGGGVHFTQGGGGSICPFSTEVHFQSHTYAYKGLTVVVCHRGLVYWKSTDLSDRS